MFLDFFLPCLGIACGISAGIAIVSIAVIVLMFAAWLIRDAFEDVLDKWGEDK